VIKPTLAKEELVDRIPDVVDLGEEPVDEVLAKGLWRQIQHKIVDLVRGHSAILEQLLELLGRCAMIVKAE
jgi:hypothetical protein